MWSFVSAKLTKLSHSTNPVRRLLQGKSASVAVTFGIMGPVLFLAVGAAVDYSLFERERLRLQAQVDAAAIASVREMQLAKSDTQRIKAVAWNFVRNSEPRAWVDTNVDLEAASVTVNAYKRFDPKMTELLWPDIPIVKVSATAKLNGMLPLCLLALDRSAPATVHLEQAAMMTATGCMVYSNSRSSYGLQAKDSAVLKAGLICSAGGRARTAGAKLTPEPELDCPRLDDPLASRPTPPDSVCRFSDTVIRGGIRILEPGVYCRGLKITDGAEVTLSPGVYVIKNGPLIVEGGATLNGIGVGIYLSGAGSNLTFAAASTINLSAPKDGPMAGLLIYDDPAGTQALAIPPYPLPLPLIGALLNALLPPGPPREHKILSDNARLLLGTIYMPKGRLIIDASKPIADRSAYTVLVVQRIDLHAGPNLVLNSDYSASDVPVPKGVGPYGNNIMLTN